MVSENERNSVESINTKVWCFEGAVDCGRVKLTIVALNFNLMKKNLL